MGYLIFRGVSTASIPNVYVSQMPSHKKASMRFTEYYVKGRDGALHVDEGLANFDIQVVLVLIKATAATRQLVNAWADGTGKLVSSDDLTHCYNATVKEEIQWNRTAANGGFYDTATITFNCQPFMYETTDSVNVFTADGQLSNPGSATAFPMIQVEGSGDCTFSVAGEEITLTGVASGVPVYLDCANGYVYTGYGAREMTGNFPELPLGTSQVVVGTNVSKLTITPHWRWV